MIMQIADGVVEYFDNVVKKNNLEIKMVTLLQLETLPDYIEG